MADELQGDQLQGTPTPVTPAGTATQGGNADQAKMAGTPAQKKPVIQKAVQPTQLSRQQRLTTGPTKQAKELGQQAYERADRLKTVGALGARLDAKIQAHLQEQVTGQDLQAGVDTEAVKDPELQKALEAFLTSEKTEADIAPLRQAFSDAGLEPTLADDPDYLNTLFQGVGDVFSQVQRPETLTLGEVQLFEDETEETEIADILGLDNVEALRAMTPEQLEAAVAAAEAQEFSRVDALRAELYGASPLRRQQIQAQLREMGESGEETADIMVDKSIQEIEKGQTINFAGQQYDIKELLSDEGMSQEIRRASEDEDYLQDLYETEPELAAWVEKNRDAIQATRDAAGEAARASSEVQDQLQSLLEDIPEDLQGLILKDIPEFATEQDLRGLRARAERYTNLDPKVQSFMQVNPDMAEEVLRSPGLKEYITSGEEELSNWVQDNPSLLEDLRRMDAAQITEQVEVSKLLQESEEAGPGTYQYVIDDLLGLSPGEFITDPDIAQKVREVQEQLQGLPTDVFVDADDYFLPMLEAGEFNVSKLKYLVEDPDSWHEVKEEWDIKKIIEGGDEQELFEHIFGEISEEDIVQVLSRDPTGKVKNTEDGKKLLSALEMLVGPKLSAEFQDKFYREGDPHGTGMLEQVRASLLENLSGGPSASLIMDDQRRGKNVGDLLEELQTSFFTKETARPLKGVKKVPEPEAGRVNTLTNRVDGAEKKISELDTAIEQAQKKRRDASIQGARQSLPLDMIKKNVKQYEDEVAALQEKKAVQQSIIDKWQPELEELR